MPTDNNQHHQDLGPPKADFSAPPPYEQCSNTIALPQQQQQQQQIQQHADNGMRSNLQMQNQEMLQQIQQEIPLHHGKLPTYEEVEIEKSLNGELPPEFLSVHHNGMQTSLPPLPPPNPLLTHELGMIVGEAGVGRTGAQQPLPPPLTFIAIDSSNAEQFANAAAGDNALLGTDIMFVAAFIVAFLFNWIGFLMLTCFCHTIAARYGALSGFGLSLAKWTLIVKHSTDLASHENSWLWWLIMAFGFLICIRALIQYVSIKRTWRLLSASAQERLLFFY